MQHSEFEIEEEIVAVEHEIEKIEIMNSILTLDLEKERELNKQLREEVRLGGV